MNLKLVKDHIPTSSKKYTKISMKPLHITVHSTGNPKSTARNERAWLTNPSNTNVVGYHYVVDDKEAIEVAPPNMVMYHAGDGKGQGNRASIGVEICESGNREKALANAVDLIVYLIKEHNTTSVVRHYDWSRKNCPWILNVDKKWTLWHQFHKRVMDTYNNNKATPQPTKVKFNLKGKNTTLDGFIEDGKTFVIIRPMLEQLGYSVGWDNSEKAVTVNGKITKIDSKIADGRTYGIVRPLLESLGHKVDFDNSTKTIIVK